MATSTVTPFLHVDVLELGVDDLLIAARLRLLAGARVRRRPGCRAALGGFAEALHGLGQRLDPLADPGGIAARQPRAQVRDRQLERPAPRRADLGALLTEPLVGRVELRGGRV